MVTTTKFSRPEEMKKFALIGAAGYIAPRHLKAIKDVGGELVAAMDVNDSVGRLDAFFPDARFFSRYDEFVAFILDEKLKGRSLDYISICSPNFLHIAHIKFALRQGIDVICEKPLVLSTEHLKELEQYENSYEARVFSILQLRLHDSIKKLKESLPTLDSKRKQKVVLTYLTSRGQWYLHSWKGDESKSGGLAANIGVHFFDMLHDVFGRLESLQVHYSDEKTASGFLEFQRAQVVWFMSIDEGFLPSNAVHGEKKTYRSIEIEGKELEFSEGFTELHTLSYQKIIAGEGFGLKDNEAAIGIVERIRTGVRTSDLTYMHPLLETSGLTLKS